MNGLMLFVMFLVPTQKCLDRVYKENLGPCHDARQYMDSIVFDSQWVVSQSQGETRIVCDRIPEKDRKPIPESSFKLAMLRPECPKDDCYECIVRRLELLPDDSPPVVLDNFVGYVGISTVSFRGAVTLSTATATARGRGDKGMQGGHAWGGK